MFFHILMGRQWTKLLFLLRYHLVIYDLVIYVSLNDLPVV